MNCRRFFGFRPFWKDRAQDAKKVNKMDPKARQVRSKFAFSGTSWRQVGQPSAIWAPTWPILAPRCAPNRHPNGAPDSPQIASWAILAPRGSPMSSKVPLESQFSLIFLQFCTKFNCFSEQLSSIFSRRFGTVAGWRAQRIGYIYIYIYIYTCV